MTITVETPNPDAAEHLRWPNHPARSWFRVVDTDGSTIAFIPDEPSAVEYANFLNADRSRYYGRLPEDLR